MSLFVNVDTTGLDSLASSLERDLDRLIRDATVATGKVTSAKAKRGGFQDHTRQLRSTISDRNIGKRGEWYMVEVVAPMPYASFVEHGTDAHDIWPKAGYKLNGPVRQGQTRRATGAGPHQQIVGRGMALRWKVGGQQFFARMVHHPGGRAIPFMEPAADYGQQYIETFVRSGFAGIAARLETHG
jgi:hypothetical protein